MAQVLYRKYRSKKLSEIVGQEHITKTLSEALKTDRISHAYLFTGPRGVGKTSIARILAHEVNNLPYNDDQPHIDIIEIDAASNRRIDEIRDLRDKVHIMPAAAQYKVYIIDEVHMLTKEAFNALLKTLEEPPAHVIFILATTDPHKLPDTIISRTQIFNFKPINQLEAVNHLKSIAKQEKIKITDQALELIAQHGEGSFRDSISLLDQLGNGTKEITEEDVREILGIPPSSAIDNLIKLIEEPKTSYKKLTSDINELYSQGYGPSLLAKKLMNELRDKLVNDQLKMTPQKAIHLLKELLDIDSKSDPNSYLLLILLSSLEQNDKPVDKGITGNQISKAQVEDKPHTITKEVKIDKKNINSELESIWPKVLKELKSHYNTLYGIVRMAEPVFKDNNHLELIFDFAFHKKQVSEPKNKQILANIILDLTSLNYRIDCLINETGRTLNTSEHLKSPDPKDDNLDHISKIFGGGELVD